MLSSNSEALLRSFTGDDDMAVAIEMKKGKNYKFLSPDE